ncbi:MAG: NusG domain II-containing protein [Clostridiales bacterium]|nr:NusG domain II-containing protein [Clostridiales bacterium]
MKKRSLMAVCFGMFAAMALQYGCGAQPDGVAPPVAPPTATPGATLEPAPAGDLPEEYIIIYVRDIPYKIVPLDDPQIVTIDQGNGMINEIAVGARDVHMAHATCANQDCVEQGEVTTTNIDARVLGGWIVCLPNGVSVQMVVKE